VAGIEGLGRRCWLIAGGDGKGQDFSPLIEPVRRNASGVVLIGRDAPLLRDVLEPTGVPLIECDSMAAALEYASAAARSGEAVLLSPACASFDMFRNYGHRGEVFMAAVRVLAERRGIAMELPC
jgi:UDP-N-acetylmuramoylalanine--D-glutamate ligase